MTDAHGATEANHNGRGPSVHLSLSAGQWAEVKAAAALRGQTLQEVGTRLFLDWLAKEGMTAARRST